jgi:ferredoxin-NADP reductase
LRRVHPPRRRARHRTASRETHALDAADLSTQNDGVPLPAFSELVPAFLVRRAVVAADQIAVSVAVPAGLRAAHERPGQFVKMAVIAPSGARREGLFAMWNAPLEDTAEDGGVDDAGDPIGPVSTLRFLLRTNNPEGGEAADTLASLPIGAPVLVSEPAGVGFDLSRSGGRHLAFVATGTALAPVRAGIEDALTHPPGSLSTSLDLGLRSPAHLPEPEALERYRRSGLEVHVHYSEPQPDGSVRGSLAHEALLARLLERGRIADTFVVAVGQPAMVKALRARLASLGGDPADVVSNH